MSMLGGIVFFAHQVGGFLGGWLGGVLFDRLGSYDGAWAMAISLSLIAAVLNAGIRLPAAAFYLYRSPLMEMMLSATAFCGRAPPYGVRRPVSRPHPRRACRPPW